MNYHPVAPSAELEEGKGRPYIVEGRRLALVRFGGIVHALEDRCTHADASIACGPVENGCIVCPWHYAEFDLRSGEALSGPATGFIPVFPVKEEEGMVFVALEPVASA